MGIKFLDPVLAQRIAAGEVIERPSSVVRELLDNSIDAHSKSINVWIEEGGIGSITVSDDGEGIAKEDLEKICRSHATSKISTLEDLFRIQTMGFRGEALYSIASCSKITVHSRGKQKTVDNAKEGPVEDNVASSKGTRVTVENLFGMIPARKAFLKRASAEAASCKNTLIEKAMAFPDIEFRFFQDGELKVYFPSCSPKQRVLDCFSSAQGFIASDTEEFFYQEENFKLYGVGTTSESYRSDRSKIKIFVNRHAVEDYPLTAAVVSGYSETFPGGRFPYFCLFANIDPELVDFNIHPSKRECRIRIKAKLTSAVTAMIRSALKKKTYKVLSEERLSESQPYLSGEERRGRLGAEGEPSYTPRPYSGRGFERSDLSSGRKLDPSWFQRARQIMGSSQSKVEFQEPGTRNYRYIGQVFRLFLVVEKEGKILFVDQHAAHERILYEEFSKDREIQRLLIPYRFSVERDTDAFLLENSYLYSDFGIELTRPGEMLWEIDALPGISKGAEDKIASFIKNNAGDLDKIKKDLFSTLACRKAIKAGDEVDRLTAISLLDKVFLLDKPCCPHGRIFIAEISEESLREAVGRFE